ncbi:hypothetical protein HanRHA438_Chr03g0126101 [Helianthus annuus]|nr:hypothetical protein HanRHA438_Chr03g0126101 [Helianthus annuus]
MFGHRGGFLHSHHRHRHRCHRRVSASPRQLHLHQIFTWVNRCLIFIWLNRSLILNSSELD